MLRSFWLFVCLLASAGPVLAQAIPGVMVTPRRPCCCCCAGDSAWAAPRPVTHWREVRYTFSMLNPALLPLALTEVGPTPGEVGNRQPLGQAQVFALQMWSFDVMSPRVFVGTDAHLGWASQYQASLNHPLLQLRTNAMFQLGLKTGVNLLMTARARVYVQGKADANFVSLGTRRRVDDLGLDSWNRFLWRQGDVIAYDQLADALVGTDIWESQQSLNRTVFTGQVGLGFDYRVGRSFRLGAYVGHNTQLGPATAEWHYSYTRTQDDHLRYRVSGVPIEANLSGLMASFTFGWVIGGRAATAL
jgi:hypothetical protein